MNTKTILGWSALLLIVIAMAACGKPLAPVYGGIENFRVNGLGVGQSAVSADLKYYNPNGFNMKLKSGTVDVYMNNRFLGKTILDTSIFIPAKDSFLIPVSMAVDMKQVYSNALDILLSNEVTIKLDGAAKLGKGLLFFNLPIQYEGKQKLDIKL
jgi:LEA14-like dessication related protein